MIASVRQSGGLGSSTDSVIQTDQLRNASLPDPASLRPSDDSTRLQIEEILSLPSLEALIETFIEPDIGDPLLLMPPQFRETRRQVLQSFNGAGLSDAAAILADQIESDDLLIEQLRAIVAA
ncbi:MAG: hypothetical protein ACR2RE_18145 [Geminicoccaceae bacterium]